jgi:hypothetical protein
MSEEKSVFDRSMEMWERWTGTYMDTMAKAMERTMDQSAAFRKQVDRAVAMAVETQLGATLTAIRALEKQIETLSHKMDELLKQQDR